MSHRIYARVSRVLLIAELLAPLRQGATVAELLRDVVDLTGEPCCERTIYRDLVFLESLRVVEKACQRGQAPRWRWVDGSIRAAIYERMAELRDRQQDTCAA